MRIWIPLILLLALALAPVHAAPTPAPAKRMPTPTTFDVEGKVLAVSKGAFEVSVIRARLRGLKSGMRLRIEETSTTRFLRAGKAAKPAELKAGETVRVRGMIRRSGRTVRYVATSVTIVR